MKKTFNTIHPRESVSKNQVAKEPKTLSLRQISNLESIYGDLGSRMSISGCVYVQVVPCHIIEVPRVSQKCPLSYWSESLLQTAGVLPAFVARLTF